MTHRSHGFTLTELMVVLAIAATLLAIGTPSFREFRRNNRLVGIANDILAATQMARTESIKRQVSVSLCPSSDGATCSSGQAFPGWIAFVDTNSDCVRDISEIIVRTGPTIDAAVTSKSNGNCISFAPTGFRQTIAGKTTAANTVFCDSRGFALQTGTTLSAARGVEVGATGRARITRNKAEMTTGPPGTGWGLVCP